MYEAMPHSMLCVPMRGKVYEVSIIIVDGPTYPLRHTTCRYRRVALRSAFETDCSQAFCTT